MKNVPTLYDDEQGFEVQKYTEFFLKNSDFVDGSQKFELLFLTSYNMVSV